MLLIGSVAPWVFAGIAALNTVAVIMLLVPSANLRLEQQARDTGSAAALIKFSTTLTGAIGIQRVSAHAGNLSRAVVFYGSASEPPAPSFGCLSDANPSSQTM